MPIAGLRTARSSPPPPRADFLTTMSAEEREWMKQHGIFLNHLLDQGKIVTGVLPAP